MNDNKIGKKEAALLLFVKSIPIAMIVAIFGLISGAYFFQSEKAKLLAIIGGMIALFMILIGSYCYGYCSKKLRKEALNEIIEGNKKLIEFYNELSEKKINLISLEEFITNIALSHFKTNRDKSIEEIMNTMEMNKVQISALYKKHRRQHPKEIAALLAAGNAVLIEIEKVKTGPMPKRSKEYLDALTSIHQHQYQEYVQRLQPFIVNLETQQKQWEKEVAELQAITILAQEVLKK